MNLADLYRAQGRDPEGERILREGLKVAPKKAILHHALGLALVRMKRADEAVGELERAALLEPQNARFGYVLAVALHSAGQSDAALATLKKILADHPNNRDVLEALASFYSGRGEGMKAKKYADRLKTLTDN